MLKPSTDIIQGFFFFRWTDLWYKPKTETYASSGLCEYNQTLN